MRCDDDYAYGGCYLHGPYDPDATGASIAADFLVFCLLAHRRGAVPPAWPWADFLKVAAKFARFAFEKSDAQERWGSENVFSAAMGGRSLRYTGELIYGSSMMAQKKTKEHLELLGCAQSMPLADLPTALFAPVGRRAPWLEFMADVKRDE
jgi:hypothetical protein